jgi:hypothetical protein|tara:strand:- start:161 stop:487 length:327 start_codon:yes stop_codon:yes gene_type:complete
MLLRIPQDEALRRTPPPLFAEDEGKAPRRDEELVALASSSPSPGGGNVCTCPPLDTEERPYYYPPLWEQARPRELPMSWAAVPTDQAADPIQQHEDDEDAVVALLLAL